MESKSFVDKVYDAYIKEDYSYGDNNLNPKREIKRMSLKDTNEQLDRILASIQRKVTEISMKYPDTNFKTEDAIGNFGGSGGKVKGIPSSVREAIHKAGGSGNTIVMIPSMDGDTSPLMAEIELSISKILATISSGDNSSESDEKIGDNFSTDGLDLFDINCNGTLNLITGGENINTEDVKTEPETSNVPSDNAPQDIGGETTNSTDDTSDMAMIEAVDKAIAQMDADLAKKEQNARACAIKDLGLMNAFLMILRIIQMIKNAMNPLMNILFDTIKLVVLASGCWNNPTNISEIIQRIVIKLVAILIMIIAMLVQMFWELLGLDCLTAEAKSVIDQIKEALTGVTTTYNKCERLAMSFGANVEKVTDAFDEAKEAIDEVLKNLSTDKLKETFDLSGMAEDIYNNGLGGKEGMTQAMMSGLQNTGAYNDILSTIESVKSMKETANNTIDLLMKSKGGKGSNATVRKIATQLHDVQAK